MKKILRFYHQPFHLDQSKLTRLATVLREKATELPGHVQEEYDLHLSNHKLVETGSLEDVLGRDNSERSRIEQLTATFSVFPEDEAFPSSVVAVEFDGQRTAQVMVSAQSTNSQWAADVSSLAEEQVERTLKNELMYRLARSGEIFYPLAMFMVAAVVAIFLVVRAPSDERRTPAANMWLSPSDVAELEQASEAKEPDLAAQVLARQLRNLQTGQSRGVVQRLAPNWRAGLLALPLVVAMSCLVYLLARCYPGAVFAWGDEEARFQKVLGRRRAAWGLMAGFVVVEVLSNLFGIALDSLR